MEKYHKSIESIKTASLRILTIIFSLLVIVIISNILLAILNLTPNWLISLVPLGMVVTLIVSLTRMPLKGIKSRLAEVLDSSESILLKESTENQEKIKKEIDSMEDEKRKHREANIKRENELENDYQRRVTELDNDYRRRVIQIEMKHFRADFKFVITDSDTSDRNPIINQPITIEEYLIQLSAIINIPITILKILYQYYIGKVNDDDWNLIKSSNTEMETLLGILRRAGKLTIKVSEFQNEILIKVFTLFPSFDLEGYNGLIEKLDKYLMFVQQYQDYLTDQGITFLHERSWEKILDYLKIIFPHFTDNDLFMWEMGDNCLNLDIESPLNKSIARCILFQYLVIKFPDANDNYCVLIANDEDATAILKYIVQEHPEENEIGRFLLEIDKSLIEIIPQVKKERLYRKFVEELKNGRFVRDEMELFRLFIEDRIKADEFREMAAIVFDQKKPLNLSNALRHYFSIKIHDTEFLKSLNLNPIIKPYLLTFYSVDKLAEYLEKLIVPHPKEFKLDAKYAGAQYTTSARIGILTDAVDSLDKLENEIKKELFEKIKQDVLYQNTYDVLVKVLNFFKENIKEFDEYDEIMLAYENLFLGMDDPSVLLGHLEELFHGLPIEKQHDIGSEWNILFGNLSGYPPKFQVLIHELKYEPGTIKVFGNINQLEPFEKMKELFAKTSRSPETLLALLEGNSGGDGISIRDINRKLVEFMSFSELLECSQSQELTDVSINFRDKKIEALLSRKTTVKIIQEINPEIDNLLDFSFFAGEQLGLNVRSKIYDYDEYALLVESTLDESNAFITIWKQKLGDYYNKKFGDEKVQKIARVMLRSVLYIALVVYHEIIKIPVISKLPEQNVEEYEKILQTCFRITEQMERTPNSFEILDESGIRNLILLNLNASYPNSVGGETFSVGGKTDILLRKEGVVTFIAECKYWKDHTYLLGAIDDQLMNYISWRDTKNAIFVFNRNVEQTPVLEKIDKIISEHPCCEGKSKFTTYGLNQPGIMGYNFHHARDVGMKFLLTVMVFHIPHVTLPKRRRKGS